ncbi:ATP-binding protein [Thiovibrio sp. JS02]
MGAEQDNLRDGHALSALLRKVEAAKEEWEKAMDCVTDMVILTDEQNNIRRCNLAFSVFCEKNFSQLLGRSWPEEAEAGGLRERDGGGEPEGAVEMIHQGSGRVYHRRMYPLVIKKERIGTVVVLQDITERTAATQKLLEHRTALLGALDDLSGMFERIAGQQKFGAYFSLPPGMGQCWQSMQCGQTDCPCYGREPMCCWRIAGTQCLGEAQGTHAQKIGDCERCRFYNESITDPVHLIGEKFNRMMFILEAKNQELSEAYDKLKASQSHLLHQEKMASIGQLAAGVAHEINNPVGFVKSNLGTLAKYVGRLEAFLGAQAAVLDRAGNLPGAEELRRERERLKIDHVLADAVELIKESLDGVDRVQGIVRNLKSFSRIDQAEVVKADVNRCLEETLNIVWNELKYKTSVHKELGNLPLLQCYPQQLNQVFMNLLVNAGQSIEGHGDIFIKTWEEGNRVMVEIRDTGCGIPRENLGRLFEPFFTTKEVGKGTGLGLSIAYDIVTKKHGGTISVKSTVGVGSTFTVELPLSAGEN